MQCAICGYLLDHTDSFCPRCVALSRRGIDPHTARANPTNAQLNRAPTRVLPDAQRHRDTIATLLAGIATVLLCLGIFSGALAVFLGIATLHEHSSADVIPLIIGGLAGFLFSLFQYAILSCLAEILRALGRLEDHAPPS